MTENVAKLFERIPAYLYKYFNASDQALSNIKAALVDSRLYFARASTFNDPLDCRIPFRFEGTELAITTHWRKKLKDEHFQRIGGSHKWHKERIRQMVKLGRTHAGQDRLMQPIFELMDKQGILCLSRHPDSMLMWSYYSAGHAGLVLRLRITPEILAQIRQPYVPMEVKYCKAFPDISYYRSDMTEQIEGVLGHKAEAWAHEGEWRIVLKDRVGLQTMPASMIDGVIFGLNTGAEVQAKVREYLKARASKTHLFQVRHRRRSFELEVVPMEE